MPTHYGGFVLSPNPVILMFKRRRQSGRELSDSCSGGDVPHVAGRQATRRDRDRCNGSYLNIEHIAPSHP
ncbi:hypothetical protein JYU34_001693 [Plutella xylostella]|uniref:Uncharacterized protein n=1 Tax=Plutella xylostella TaxID=51655 RepID=A0ABQ7R4I8_PLUXY|nr:hypothetical protein JYU34_001693 [Plutella xylostella]